MERTLTPEFELELKALFESILVKYGYDFRRYSPPSMKRMVVQAMNRMGCPTLLTLREKILEDSLAFDELIQSLTIAVSEMFRDPSFFLALREKVMPILKTYPSIKVWVAGCSTGEEVYSLAILLQEEKLLAQTTLYATDINPRSLEKAEKGIFDLKEVPKFSQNYQASGGKQALSNYYTTGANSVTFDSTLKQNVTFTDHSLVTDSVFSEMHLILCRNVLIYFDRKLQHRAFGLFHDSLCRKGFLGLGAQETLQFSHYASHFDTFVKQERIFQKK